MRSLAKHLQLDDRQVIGLGYVSDDRYFAILKGCHALVMPTLAQGGGSFPVTEATLIHKPVVCSDIPAMWESAEPGGGAQLWFDPRDPQALASALRTLEEDHARLSIQAKSISHAIQRTWADVANDYMAAFRVVTGAVARERASASRLPPSSGCP